MSRVRQEKRIPEKKTMVKQKNNKQTREKKKKRMNETIQLNSA